MGNRGIGGFPTYKPEAKGKQECMNAMGRKIVELQKEIEFFTAGLNKIDLLEEKHFYELTHSGMISLVQCREFGRDHVRFRLFANSVCQQDARMQEEFSCIWNGDFQTKPVDPKDAMLYINYAWKTRHYDKLLKGTYRCPPTKSEGSPESLQIPGAPNAG